MLSALLDELDRQRAAWLNDPRMTGAYTQRAGYPPGFDGRCWPKDLAALIKASEDAGYRPGFLRAIGRANERFRGVHSSGLVDAAMYRWTGRRWKERAMSDGANLGRRGR